MQKTSVIQEQEAATVEAVAPSLYKVIMYNDDYTTAQFVVTILSEVFELTQRQATRLMLFIQKRGSGVCGIYAHDIAAQKVAAVTKAARSEGYPLLCVMERAGQDDKE